MVSLNQILGFCEPLKFKVVLVGCRPFKVTRKKGVNTRCQKYSKILVQKIIQTSKNNSSKDDFYRDDSSSDDSLMDNSSMDDSSKDD